MIYNCPKCGLSKSDGAMSSTLPQCKCDWNSAPQRKPDYEAEFIKDWNEGKVKRVSDGKRMVPEREWQGLTDEEMFDCLAQTDGEAKRLPLGFKWFAEAIEAKLKEKNT